MTLGHFVGLHRSVSDTSEVFDEERSLVVKELVLVLLVGQQHLIHRLRHRPEEPTQLLLTVLASYTQLAQQTSHNCIER